MLIFWLIRLHNKAHDNFPKKIIKDLDLDNLQSDIFHYNRAGTEQENNRAKLREPKWKSFHLLP